ncbi:hypothetical protein HETIRDRAFT_329612 [Heterobasidion irregulare TC 32-1]|uniref:Uncharacterized protein n=1 Tax=Heterobasidion irregulare (strain TC 32-1) TaxID=747525 RepID=W4JQM1_HETIT|nr:uncharacterized protein HETIRDRAFT_329612 [Heterobasidion irregulare TC 32-1]ETW75857.1 hypothetical protein HETIRDRAFT_329612 [Heterobasidion irregulare TC 32-1]
MTSRITYSYKGLKRSRPHTVSDDGYDDRPLQDVPATTPTTTPISHSRKRPRVQVEVLLPVSPSKNSPARKPHINVDNVSTETPKQPTSSGGSPKKRAHVEVLLPSPHKTTFSPRSIHDASKPPSGSDVAQIFPEKYLEQVRGPHETHSPSPKKRLKVEVLLQSPHRTTPSPQRNHSPLKPSTSFQRRRIMSTEEDSESERERSAKNSRANVVSRVVESMQRVGFTLSCSSSAFIRSKTGGSDIDDDDILPVLNIAPKRKAAIQLTPAYASTSRGTAQRAVKESSRPLKTTVPKRTSSTGVERTLSTSKLTSRVSTMNLTSLRPKESRPSSSKNTNRPFATFPRHSPHRETSASLPGEAKVPSLARTPLKSYLFDSTSPLTPLPTNSPSKRSPITPSKSLDSVRPSTPRSPAKDLSDLFNFVTPKTGLSKLPDKPKVPLVKRMLARSRTEPSLGAAVSDNRPGSMNSISFSGSLRNADTLVDTPAAGASQSASGSGSNAPMLPVTPTSESESQARATAVPQSQIRTYAGKSRSFLVPVPASGVPGALDDDLDLENTRESYADLRSRWGVDNSEDDPLPRSPSPEPVSGKGKGKAKERSRVVLPSNMMNDLKSITELRSKGESRRFMDEVGYLFEGMGKNVGVGVRRGRQVFPLLQLRPWSLI